MQKRIWLSAPLVALAFMALVATRSEGKLETIEQIIPGVWFRQGDLDQYGHCNNIVITTTSFAMGITNRREIRKSMRPSVLTGIDHLRNPQI